MSAGIVLAGGRSTRMGRPKAALEWHGSTLLRRVTGLVARAVDGPVIVVRAPGQELPECGAEVVEDELEGRGPLQGLAAGLAALEGRADVAYVSSADVPLLHPAFVRRVVAALDEESDVALPHIGGFAQPLAAAYRVALRPVVARLLAQDRLRPADLFAECRVRRLGEDALPHPESVLDLDEPADYETARARPAPEVTVVLDGGRAIVRAVTLGAAAAACGVAPGGQVRATVDGAETRDPEHPLAAGDEVTLMTR